MNTEQEITNIIKSVITSAQSSVPEAVIIDTAKLKLMIILNQ